MIPIRNCIQMFRVTHGIDQQTMADELGITRTYLSKLENQKFSPGPELMASICIYFYKELGEVFFINSDEEVDIGCRKKKG